MYNKILNDCLKKNIINEESCFGNLVWKVKIIHINNFIFIWESVTKIFYFCISRKFTAQNWSPILSIIILSLKKRDIKILRTIYTILFIDRCHWWNATKMNARECVQGENIDGYKRDFAITFKHRPFALVLLIVISNDGSRQTLFSEFRKSAELSDVHIIRNRCVREKLVINHTIELIINFNWCQNYHVFTLSPTSNKGYMKFWQLEFIFILHANRCAPIYN